MAQSSSAPTSQPGNQLNSTSGRNNQQTTSDDDNHSSNDNKNSETLEHEDGQYGL